MTAWPGVTIHASKEKCSNGKFRILSLESKFLKTWNKSCDVNETNQWRPLKAKIRTYSAAQICPNQNIRVIRVIPIRVYAYAYTRIHVCIYANTFLLLYVWLQTCRKFFTSSVKATNCLFFTTLYKETQGTFVPLRVTFYKICSVLNGGIQHLKKTCHGSQQSKTSDRKHTVRSCCHSRIALFPRVRNRRMFPANWQVDILLFNTSLNHGWAEEGR